MYKNRKILCCNCPDQFCVADVFFCPLHPKTHSFWRPQLKFNTDRPTECFVHFHFFKPIFDKHICENHIFWAINEPYWDWKLCRNMCVWVRKHLYENMHALVIYLLSTFWSTVASINSNWSVHNVCKTHTKANNTKMHSQYPNSSRKAQNIPTKWGKMWNNIRWGRFFFRWRHNCMIFRNWFDHGFDDDLLIQSA